MNLRLLVVAVLMCMPLSAANALDEKSTESTILLLPKVEGWKHAYVDRRENLIAHEFIPSTDTVKNWSGMLTVHKLVGELSEVPRFHSLGGVVAAHALNRLPEKEPRIVLARMYKMFQHNCRSSKAHVFDQGKKDGNSFMGVLLSCFQEKNSSPPKGNITIAYAFSMNDGLYVVQWAWRGPQYSKPPIETSEMIKWSDHLGSVKFCSNPPSETTCGENYLKNFWVIN